MITLGKMFVSLSFFLCNQTRYKTNSNGNSYSVIKKKFLI